MPIPLEKLLALPGNDTHQGTFLHCEINKLIPNIDDLVQDYSISIAYAILL